MHSASASCTSLVFQLTSFLTATYTLKSLNCIKFAHSDKKFTCLHLGVPLTFGSCNKDWPSPPINIVLIRKYTCLCHPIRQSEDFIHWDWEINVFTDCSSWHLLPTTTLQAEKLHSQCTPWKLQGVKIENVVLWHSDIHNVHDLNCNLRFTSFWRT